MKKSIIITILILVVGIFGLAYIGHKSPTPKESKVETKEDNRPYRRTHVSTVLSDDDGCIINSSPSWGSSLYPVTQEPDPLPVEIESRKKAENDLKSCQKKYVEWCENVKSQSFKAYQICLETREALAK